MFVDHKGKDTHHGGTALVELDGTFLELGLLIESVPAVVDRVVTEVTDEFSSGDVLHDGKLKEANEGNQLANSGTRDGVEGGETVGDVSKGKSRVVNVSWKTNSGLSNKVSDDGKHGDTSVLELDVSETVELFLVTIGHESEGIEEAKRRLGSKLILESLQGGGGGGLLDRSESSGRGDKGGENGGLHVENLLLTKLWESRRDLSERNDFWLQLGAHQRYYQNSCVLRSTSRFFAVMIGRITYTYFGYQVEVILKPTAQANFKTLLVPTPTICTYVEYTICIAPSADYHLTRTVRQSDDNANCFRKFVCRKVAIAAASSRTLYGNQ